MPPFLFKTNDKVRVKAERDKIGVITRSLPLINQQCWYEVFFHATDIRNLPEAGLELAPAGESIESLLKSSAFSRKESLSKLFTFTKLSIPVRNNLYAFGSSRTQFLEYQFIPLLKFLDSRNQKLLIADEVGLGKTIEAGLIMIEMRARYALDRTLIVCPSALTGKWQMEMKNRFDEYFEVYDSDKIRRFLRDLDEQGESIQLRAICSLQTMRNQELMEEWEAAAPPIDLLVVDEAHHMRNPGTNSNALGRLLYETAESMLLLTAAPVHLGSLDLFNLLRILDSEEFDTPDVFNNRLAANEPIIKAINLLTRSSYENLQLALAELRALVNGLEGNRFKNNPIYDDVLYKLEHSNSTDYKAIVDIQRDVHQLSLLSHILTRTRKRDVQESAKRDAKVIAVDFTKQEMEFYNAVTAYVIARANSKTVGSFAAFASMMPQRQVASCLQAVAEKYRIQGELLTVAGIEGEGSDISLEDMTSGINNAEVDEQQDVQSDPHAKVVDAAHNLGQVDSKYDAFIKTLREIEGAEPGRKVIVFSYFRKTLSYLAQKLRDDGFSNLVISGGVPPDERPAVIRQFKDDPNIRILLSSEVGSEGLDFQFCHIVFNYDLPWNPMVVEQRIGRVDRIGQKSERILVYNLSVRGTIESRILERLYSRIKIFERSIGDLEAILGDEMRELTRELLTSRLTPGEQEQLIEAAAMRIEQKRKNIEQLEQESTRLIGHDQFFTDELRRIGENKLYLSADSIRVFVEEFLKRDYPTCTLTNQDNGTIYRLKINDNLRNLIRHSIPSDDRSLGRFLSRCSLGAIDVTFDGSIATERDELEFINIHHPLIRTIVKHYKEHPDELHPVAKVEIRTDLVPTGEYFYFLYSVETIAARSEKRIEMVVLSRAQPMPVDEAITNKLLDAIITTGSTPDHDPKLDSEEVESLLQAANDELGKKISRIRADLERTNNALIQRQLESLKQSYSSKKDKKENQLQNAIDKRRAPQYIRMLQGGLRNLETEYQRKLTDMESKKDVSISFTHTAAGYLKVYA